MSTTNHTPGPWDGKRIRFRLPRNCDWAFHSAGTPESIAESEANGQLIWAAPDLLEVLEQMVAMMDCGDEFGAGSQWHTEAKAAIAKAKGEA